MKRGFSPSLSAEIVTAVHSTLVGTRIVNVSALARQIQRRNPAENVALEDIEYAVFDEAQRHGSAIEFALDGEVLPGGAAAGEPGIGRPGWPRDAAAGEADGAGMMLTRN